MFKTFHFQTEKEQETKKHMEELIPKMTRRLVNDLNKVAGKTTHKGEKESKKKQMKSEVPEIT